MSVLQKLLKPTHVCRLLTPPSRHKLPVATVMGVFEEDKKSGYGKDPPGIKEYPRMVKEGFSELGAELNMFKDEWKEKLMCDAMWADRDYLHGDYQLLWQMNKEEDLDQWIVTTDQDHNEGFSDATLTLGKNNFGVFSGHLSSRMPKDGVVERSGYCNIRSKPKKKSFKRPIPHNLSCFTHLLIRCRGDGRQYTISLGQDSYFDLTWHDQFNYVLYTRGGPYWQLTKIPFSKFFLSAKGRIQDKQESVLLDRVTTLGLTCADQIDGPFELEIDFIGVQVDKNYREEFAYEMYEVPRHLIGT